MSLDAIKARVADVADRLLSSLATDVAFERDFVGILDLIRPAGFDVRLTVAERDSGTLVTAYCPSSSRERADEPNETKNLSETDRAVRCTIRTWYDHRTKIRPNEMDTVFRDLVGLVYRHWGERDILTLLPRLQDPAIAPRLLRFVEATATQATHMAVLHTDLDKFKSVNTEFGEPGGDAVLKEFTQRFRQSFSDIGVVVRTGGEEFSAVLFHDDAGQILERSEAFRAVMETVPFEHIKRPNTCSIGLAVYPEASTAASTRGTIEGLLHDARESERRAKNDGRNCIRLERLREEQGTRVQITPADLLLASLKVRTDLQTEQPSCFATAFGNVMATLLTRAMSASALASINTAIEKIVSTFGLSISAQPLDASVDPACVPMSSSVTAGEWAAMVGRALLRATFATGGPLSTQDKLSFRVDAGRGETCDLLLEIARNGSSVARIPLVRNVQANGDVGVVQIGRPWYALSGTSDSVRRWVPPKEVSLSRWPSALSPCLLLPIGDQAIRIAKEVQYLVADVVEIDDRPVLGGGLPDFWQSNLARVIRACLRNPNIHFIIAIGAAENASYTLDRLSMTKDQWNGSLHSLQRMLTIGSPHLQAFRDRNVKVSCISADTLSLFQAINDVHLHTEGTNPDFPFVDFESQSRRRRLPLAAPTETGRLLLCDGLRTHTLADAYPQAIDVLRSSDTPPQTEPFKRQFRELSCFKLVLTDPLNEIVPDYWRDEEQSLKDYYDRNFKEGTGLFAKHIFTKVEDGHSVYDHAFRMCVDALRNARPTRRVTLPVIPLPDRLDLPIGWFAIQIMPRFRNERWNLDFQWIWRTVEARVGFPFSTYGSIIWSRGFFEAVREELAKQPPATAVEFGELTYVALSFHMFLDAGDLQIARAIVQEASD